MKNMLLLLVLLMILITSVSAVPPNPDTASASPKQLFGYGEKNLAMDYVGDTIFVTYLIVSPKSVFRDGLRLRVFHQDLNSDGLSMTSDYISGHRSFVNYCIRKGLDFTIKLVEKNGNHDDWQVLKPKEFISERK